jgi:hypothetical protein
MNLTSHKSEAVHCRYAIVGSEDLRATESGALGKTEYGGMAEWSMAVVLKTSTLCSGKTVMLAIAISMVDAAEALRAE